MSALTGQPGTEAGHGAQRDTAVAAAFRSLSESLRPVLEGGGESLLAHAAGPAAGTAPLSSDEVISNAAVLMFGGIQTTEGMITNALWHLLTQPGQLRLVRDDPSLIPDAVEESLRLEPAAAFVDRYATTHVRIAGASIRPGDLVSVSLTAAGRDPATFPDLDAFDVRRANARLHLAFAHGPHFCLGAHLARLEAVTAVRAALGLPGLRLDPDHPTAPRGLVFRKPPSLYVRWDIG